MPRVDDPPAVPLILQVTAMFELPETVAVNWNWSPARMLAVDGEMVTETEVGVEGVVGLVGAEDGAVAAAQPQVSRAASTGVALGVERMGLRAHLKRAMDGTILSRLRGQCYWTKGKKKGNDRAGEIVECRDVNALSRDTSIAI